VLVPYWRQRLPLLTYFKQRKSMAFVVAARMVGAFLSFSAPLAK
jgi:hypothetical protein